MGVLTQCLQSGVLYLHLSYTSEATVDVEILREVVRESASGAFVVLEVCCALQQAGQLTKFTCYKVHML